MPLPDEGEYVELKILEEEGNDEEAGYVAYEHPLHSYKKFLKDHVANDFAKLKEENPDTKDIKKLIKKI